MAIAEVDPEVVKKTLHRISKARELILKRFELFEGLLCSIKPVVDPRFTDNGIPTCGVSADAVLHMHPDFAARHVNDIQLAGTLLHECGHLFNEHFERGRGKDGRMFNLAGDLAMDQFINTIFPMLDPTLPAAFGFPINMSAERYYQLLLQQAEQQSKKSRTEGSAQPKNCGSCSGNSSAKNEELAADILEQLGVRPPNLEAVKHVAAEARKEYASAGFGSKPGGHIFSDLPKDVEKKKTRTCWDRLRTRLHSEFSMAGAVTDYSKRRKSRRSFVRGIIVPGLVSYQPNISMIIDTSGSMYSVMPRVLSIVEEVARKNGLTKVNVIHADAAVQFVETVAVRDITKIKLKGGGGTDFRPALDYVAKHHRTSTAIYVTDGFGTFPKVKPPYPVLWVMTEGRRPPWGDSVHVSMREK